MELVHTLPSKLASSMLQVVMQQLSGILTSEIGLLWKVDDKLRELQATYIKIEAMLDKLDYWQIHNTILEPWLQDLERYCYDTEDLVDDLILSRPIKQEDEKPAKHPVRRHTFGSGRLTIPHQIAELQRKLEGIGSQIDKVLSAGAINSREPPTEVSSGPYYKNLLTDKTPLVPGTSRDQDKQTIILELTSLQCNPSGVSILGMDGLGKTALARTILVDERITKHFPLVLSACVSGDFQLEDIVQKLVACHSRRTRLINHPQTTESDQIDLMLQDLRSLKSLIILDDLWRVTDEDWEIFRCNYLDASPGWKILTTTRNPRVAEVTESSPFYLNRMTDDDCKKLIIHRAKLSESECNDWSKDIEEIAEKCKGMPVVANKLGLKLSKKKTGPERKEAIVQYKTDKLWDLPEFKEVFPSLNLNKPKLPPDLKRCFAYCSLFSPDHEFNRDDLIQLWEVEGFIQPQHTGQSFDHLLSRSILQPCKSRKKEQLIYKMHEFNHEFSHLLASKTFCRVGEGTNNLLCSCENIRHLSLTCQNTDEPLLRKIEQCKGLRTFLLLHQNKPKRRTLSYNFFQKLQSLRLLDLSHTNISSLPKPISPSKHLRYLDLSYTEVRKLPEPIHSLRALQILKLKNCSKLLQLPKDLNQLISLKHLHVNMRTLGRLPSNLGKLTNLEILDSFVVGKDEGCKVTELKDMGHLRELHIARLDNIRDREEAQEIMLSKKPSLRTLVLEWNTPTVEVENAEDVLEGLQPHNHLQDLVVRNYSGQKFPTWLTSPSCQLVSIYLDNCQNCQVLPSLGQLPILKILVLRSIHNVKIVDNHFCGQGERVFPCLELLEFHDMKVLANWIGLEAGNMPCLRALNIIDCPRLFNLSSLENLGCLVNLEINNCPILESLPELPPSLNGELGKLIILDSALIKERCHTGGLDWRKINDIPYVEIDLTRMLTKSSVQPPDSDKDEVSINERQPPTSSKQVNENNVSQVHQDEVPRSQNCPITPRLGDESHPLQDLETRKEDQPTSPQLQPTTTGQMAGKNHNLQDEVQRNEGHPVPSESCNSQYSEQDPSSPQSLVNESKMVQDEFSEKEHHSLVHRNPADESCTSQHEGPRSKQPLLAPPSPVNQNLSNSYEDTPQKSSSRGLSYMLRGCFSNTR